MRILVFVRCFERVVIVLSGAIVSYLGYRLYEKGIDTGDVTLTFGDLLVKGTGPGLIFMCAGIGLLAYCIRTPIKLKIKKSDDSDEIEVQLELLGSVDKPTEPDANAGGQ